MNPISIFGHLNYILTLCAYMVKDMLKLRLLAVAAGCCGITYALFYTQSILWVELTWESAGIAVNLVHIILLLREKRNLFLSEEEDRLRKILFRHMSVVEFKRLASAGQWRDYNPGDVIIKEGSPVPRISVIGSGLAEILSKRKVVAYCKAGALLGEMSYVTGEPASATVRASEQTRCLEWDQVKLKSLAGKNESLKQGFQTALSENLIRKLQKHR